VQTGKNSEYRSQNIRKTEEYKEDKGIPGRQGNTRKTREYEEDKGIRGRQGNTRKTREYEEWRFGNGCG
jgi:hypothetical protein